MVYRLLGVFLFISVFINVAHAAENSVTVGIGLSKPPYIIQEKNSGAEYEIVARTLEIAGYKMRPKYMPLKRIPYELNGGALDAGMHLRAHMSVDGFFSNDVIFYQNYAITLADTDVVLDDMGALANYSVVAFQNASKLLNEDFKDAIKGHHQYSELPNQELQVKLLAAGRVQVVISDFRIFLHFRKQVEKQLGKKIDVKFHRLFQPTPYRLAFRDRNVRDNFDQALGYLRRSGEYDEIIKKYITAEDMKELF